MRPSLVLLAVLALPSLACCKSGSPSGGGGAAPGFGSTPTSTGKPSNYDKPRPSATATTAPTAPAARPGKGKATSVHLTMGIPTDGDDSDDHLMVKPQYALSYNKRLNNPNWVSWNLNGSHFGNVPRFKGKFLVDESLPADFYRVRHDDYTGSGFDRGHLVRSEERTKTPADNEATFLMVNILPQYHDLNAGPWLRFEEYCQRLAQKENKELFLVAGGIFPKKPQTIGKGVAVPEATYKIVVVLDRNQSIEHVNETTRVIAVSMPNKEGIRGEPWGQYRTTVAALEKATRYNFLSDLPESLQSSLENRKDTGPAD
ncbi:MAG: DNA/RNA non-specific endonuclease [Myxococcales bacterium]|nr:DNA/RNA non-specific endonuclease [Polyangiaceae bacterium]MDW8251268.1 DNA/RNA non-specific endonuclease [Myxococcales bacterium]